jgi:hypothetical protein
VAGIRKTKINTKFYRIILLQKPHLGTEKEMEENIRMGLCLSGFVMNVGKGVTSCLASAPFVLRYYIIIKSIVCVEHNQRLVRTTRKIIVYPFKVQ